MTIYSPYLARCFQADFAHRRHTECENPGQFISLSKVKDIRDGNRKIKK